MLFSRDTEGQEAQKKLFEKLDMIAVTFKKISDDIFSDLDRISERLSRLEEVSGSKGEIKELKAELGRRTMFVENILMTFINSPQPVQPTKVEHLPEENTNKDDDDDDTDYTNLSPKERYLKRKKKNGGLPLP